MPLIFRVALLATACVALSLLPEAASRIGDPDPYENLAAGSALSHERVMGHPRWVVRGPLLEEGSGLQTQRILFFAASNSWLHLDFGHDVEIAGLLLQAESEAQFVVEMPAGEGSWLTIWSAAPSIGPGLRTRQHEFGSPIRTRALRIRPREGSPLAQTALSGIRVYSSLPADWPRPEGTLAATYAGAFPWFSLEQVEIAKLAFAVCGALLIVALFFLDRRGGPVSLQRAAGAALTALALASSLGWWNFLQLSNENYHRTHRHFSDAYHYYMASKYAPEVGYTNLYRCMLAADAEDGFRSARLAMPQARNLTTNELVPTEEVLAEAELCTTRFAADRWASFKRDQAFFRTRLPPSHWLLLAQDHGYNASPVWTFVGQALGNLGPMSDLHFFLLTSLDTVLLVCMWTLVWTTFGARAGAIAMLFWATNLVGNDHMFSIGAFLRIDWLFLSVVGVCLLKREKPALAGFLLMWAAMSRIFPGFLLVGLGAKILVEAARRRSLVISPPHQRLITGAAAGLVSLMILSTVTGSGVGVWPEFARNTLKHRETVQLQNIGARALVAHIDQPQIRESPRVRIRDVEASYDRPAREILVIALTVLFLPLLLLAVRDEPDWVAAILGLTWLPFATDINNYYWSVTLLCGLLAILKPVVGLGFAALMLAFSGLGIAYPHSGLGLYTWASLALLLFFTGVAAVFAAQAFSPRE